PRRWSTVRRIADSFLWFVGINPSAGKCHFASFAAAHHFASFLEVLARSLPGARLHYAVVLPRSLDHLETVVNGHAYRLLDVHILTGFAGLHSHVRMPVVRSRNADQVNGFIGQDLAKIPDLLRLLPGSGHKSAGFFKVQLVNITDRFHLHVMFQRDSQVLRAHHADADESGR